MRRLTKREKERLRSSLAAMLDTGVPYSRVAEEAGVGKSSVHDVLKLKAGKDVHDRVSQWLEAKGYLLSFEQLGLPGTDPPSIAEYIEEMQQMIKTLQDQDVSPGLRLTWVIRNMRFLIEAASAEKERLGASKEDLSEHQR